MWGGGNHRAVLGRGGSAPVAGARYNRLVGRVIRPLCKHLITQLRCYQLETGASIVCASVSLVNGRFFLWIK